jgi:hypothetical protein
MSETARKPSCTHVNELLLRLYNLSPGISTYLDDFWTDGVDYQMVFKALPTEAVRLVKDQCGPDSRLYAFDRDGHQMLGVKGKCRESPGTGEAYAKELASGSFSG